MATDTQSIKDRLDIVQLIGEYVPLKKAGTNWKANCPFHHEKSPSFMVHPEKQIWHCFGCGKGGDVFSFVQEMEGLDFVEVLKLLAKRAGVEVSLNKSETDQSQRNRLLEINSAAANFFHRFLTEMPAGETARKYLEKRGLKKQTIADWQVGFIPDQWDLLTKYLLKKGFGINDLILSGLTTKKENADLNTGRGVYDRFRGRVMFPICDTHGNVVGFTGRVLIETENSGGKYVNTPQTLLYDKSRVLYGIHRGKTELKAKDLAVIVEGQMDVIACHQAGMTNVVAASGTALTIEQIKLLKRYTNNVAMAFDADAAGQNAGKRGIEIAMEEGMNIKVIQIPDGKGKDADECLKKDPAVWFNAVKNAKGVMDWYFETILKGVDKNNFQAKQKAAASLISEIVRIPHGVERDEWLKKLSDELVIDIGVLREESKNIKNKVVKAQPPKELVSQVKSAPKSHLELLAEEFWGLVLKNYDKYGSVHALVKPEYFKKTTLFPLYETVQNVYNKENRLTIEELKANYQNGNQNTIDLLLLKPNSSDDLSGTSVEKELEQIIGRIGEEWKKQRGREIQAAISVAEKSGQKEDVEKLLVELQSL